MKSWEIYILKKGKLSRISEFSKVKDIKSTRKKQLYFYALECTIKHQNKKKKIVTVTPKYEMFTYISHKMCAKSVC